MLDRSEKKKESTNLTALKNELTLQATTISSVKF